jgi:hypothetical protein
MKKYAETDRSQFPIIKVVFTGEAASAENFPVYLDELKQNYARKESIVIIFDASKAVFPGITYQKMQAKWLKDNEQLMKDFCKGTAYVIPKLIIRKVLSAIFTFQKQPVPYKVCSNLEEALDWAKNQMKR